MADFEEGYRTTLALWREALRETADSLLKEKSYLLWLLNQVEEAESHWDQENTLGRCPVGG